MMARFLYPAKPAARAWQFVAEVDAIHTGGSRLYQTPAGMTVTVTRQGEGRTAADFLALSSTCPHLGCSVHWEGHNNRFFCPCHNGVFDPAGKPVSGPPADANQPLPSFPLKVEGNLLFIQVTLDGVTVAAAASGETGRRLG